MSPADKHRFREAAIVVLVRGHDPDLETFWVRRSEAVSFMPGFHAFPGGKVNPEDLELPLEGAADERERVLRACAIREAFEEAGVLVALAAPAEFGPLGEARRRLLAGEVQFPALACEHGWTFRADALVFAGRWKTPPFSTVRFDTTYYLARVPEGQEPSIRLGELDQGEWVRPLAALHSWRQGGPTFAAPILWSLIALAEGERSLAERLATGPERSARPVRRIELKWGVILHPMKTHPLPPATHTAAYLVGEHEMALIDPGGDEPQEIEKLVHLIESLREDGRRLKIVLLTHHHVDHTGGVEAIRERFKVPVAAHVETGRYVRLDLALADGDWIPLVPGIGDWNLRVIYTPGHTRGHLCFFHERTRSLFTGDHIPGGRGTVIIDPSEGDMGQYIGSLERLLAEPVETLFPAHGSPQGGAARRIRWLIEHRIMREGRVLDALDATPRSLAALVARAYADTPHEMWAYAERSLLAHLFKLEAEGIARCEGESWRRRADDEIGG